jgi:hypothetical protein
MLVARGSSISTNLLPTRTKRVSKMRNEKEKKNLKK